MLTLLLLACSTIHGVKPVGDGQVRLDASLGGPITELYGKPVPLPLSTIGATYGISDRTDVHAAWHSSAALMMGIAAGEAGASFMFQAPDNGWPRLMGDFTLIVAGGDTAPGAPEGGLVLLTQPALNISWDWKKHTVYGGLFGFFQPVGLNGYGGLTVGNLWGIGRTFISTELKWIAPYASSAYLVPHYYAPFSRGAVSFQLGLGIPLTKGEK